MRPVGGLPWVYARIRVWYSRLILTLSLSVTSSFGPGQVRSDQCHENTRTLERKYEFIFVTAETTKELFVSVFSYQDL